MNAAFEERLKQLKRVQNRQLKQLFKREEHEKQRWESLYVGLARHIVGRAVSKGLSEKAGSASEGAGCGHAHAHAEPKKPGHGARAADVISPDNVDSFADSLVQHMLQCKSLQAELTG